MFNYETTSFFVIIKSIYLLERKRLNGRETSSRLAGPGRRWAVTFFIIILFSFPLSMAFTQRLRWVLISTFEEIC